MSAALRTLINTLPIDRQEAFLAVLDTIPVVTERELQADQRDLARTLNKILKPQNPPPYSGAIDADACQNFIDNQEEYYTVVKLANTEWVQYTALNLTEEAKSWWRSSGLTLASPWDDFKDAFLAFHTPPNAVAAAREALESLRQGKRTVAAYTHEFRKLRRRVPTLDDGTALHWFMKGLVPDTSKEVKLRQPSSLDVAISQATLIHAILFPDGPTVSTPKNEPSPMDLDSLHIAINNLTTKVNNLHRNNNRNTYNNPRNNNNTTTNTAHPAPLTQDERDHLMNTGGCLRCRQPGHFGRDCPKYRNNNHQGRRINQVAVGNSSESGNASNNQM